MKFAVAVPVRWSDMDAYGHVNHARTVTLIEDARTRLVFEEMARRGLRSFLGGLVVSRVVVDYVAPIVHEDSPVRIELWVDDVRAASFVIHYEIRPSAGPDRLLARAETTMVPYDVANTRLRRLTADERAALAEWTPDGGVVEHTSLAAVAATSAEAADTEAANTVAAGTAAADPVGAGSVDATSTAPVGATAGGTGGVA